MLRNKKERNFVIMDGSDKKFVKEVIGVTEMVTGNTHWFNRLMKNIKCCAMDRNHPTMKVITVRSNYKQFDQLRTVLTNKYPEQCIFDVVL